MEMQGEKGRLRWVDQSCWRGDRRRCEQKKEWQRRCERRKSRRKGLQWIEEVMTGGGAGGKETLLGQMWWVQPTDNVSTCSRSNTNRPHCACFQVHTFIWEFNPVRQKEKKVVFLKCLWKINWINFSLLVIFLLQLLFRLYTLNVLRVDELTGIV